MAEIPPLYRPSQPILHVLRVKPARSEQESLNGGKRSVEIHKKLEQRRIEEQVVFASMSDINAL